jgi:hypothetical protein
MGSWGVSDVLGLLPVETTIVTASCKIVTRRAGVLYQPHTRSTSSSTTPGGKVDVDGLLVGDARAALSVEGFELHCRRTAKIMDPNNTSTSDDHANGGTVTADGHGPTASTFGLVTAQPLVTTSRTKMPRTRKAFLSGVHVGRSCTSVWQRGAFDEHFFRAKRSCRQG